MLLPLVRELDEAILKDPQLNPSLFEKLIAAQRELGLVFGDRPTCPFLRPHIVSRSQYDEVTNAARTIANAFEKLAAEALRDDELLGMLGLTESEARMVRIDPGYSRLCVSSRLDSYVSEVGFQFLEYNAETPAGIGDQMQLEAVLFDLDHMKHLLRRKPHWRPEPHKRLLTAMLDAYREWGGDAERPQIAIVDWRGVATETEFRVLQEYFARQGFRTEIVDPRVLTYDRQELRAGDFRIDIVYKRVVIHEFLERCGGDHPLARAYADRRVCMVNSFRSKIAHKKAAFAMLSDPQYAHLFTAKEVETIAQHIPWTRRMQPDNASLLGLLHEERERFVLKPNDDYGGHGVFLGWESTSSEWKQAIDIAGQRPYVVQERVPLKKTPITTFSDRVKVEDMFVDFNPFLFHNEAEGALVRLSSSPVLNMTSGGGQTALLVLEDA